MNITISPDAEQLAAIATATAAYNATLTEGTDPLTSEQYCQKALEDMVASWAQSAYADAVQRIGAAAAQMPYENRTALIAQIEGAITDA